MQMPLDGSIWILLSDKQNPLPTNSPPRESRSRLVFIGWPSTLKTKLCFSLHSASLGQRRWFSGRIEGPPIYSFGTSVSHDDSPTSQQTRKSRLRFFGSAMPRESRDTLTEETVSGGVGRAWSALWLHKEVAKREHDWLPRLWRLSGSSSSIYSRNTMHYPPIRILISSCLPSRRKSR